ncbi:hypothetical protein D3C81_1890540 [compost metagenome]
MVVGAKFLQEIPRNGRTAPRQLIHEMNIGQTASGELVGDIQIGFFDILVKPHVKQAAKG